jgi:FOG: CBS domain
MTKNPITIYFDENLEKATLLMKEKNIRHLPVINKEGKLIGMLSSRDIIKVSLEYGL